MKGRKKMKKAEVENILKLIDLKIPYKTIADLSERGKSTVARISQCGSWSKYQAFKKEIAKKYTPKPHFDKPHTDKTYEEEVIRLLKEIRDDLKEYFDV